MSSKPVFRTRVGLFGENGKKVSVKPGYHIVWERKNKCVRFFKQDLTTQLRFDHDNKMYVEPCSSDFDFINVLDLICCVLGLNVVEHLKNEDRIVYRFIEQP